MRVDDVDHAGSPAQFAQWSGAVGIEWRFGCAGQETGEKRLTGPIPPDLGDTSRGRDDAIPAATGCFDQRGNLPVTPLEGDQRASVEDEPHSGRTTAPATWLPGCARLSQKRLGLSHLDVGQRPEPRFPG